MRFLAVFLIAFLAPGLLRAEQPADLASRVETLEKQTAALQAGQTAQAKQLAKQDAKLDRILDSLADVRSQLTDGQARPATTSSAWPTSPGPTYQAQAMPIMSGYGTMGAGSSGACSSGSCGSSPGGRVGLFGRMRGR